jgi:hypothetical protein
MPAKIAPAPVATEANIERLTLETSVEHELCSVNAPEVLTRSEAARLLRCTVSTLNRIADIPRHRVGATRRYLRSELLEYVKTREAS